ncbi:MAG TPA: flagellar M-ring protein FliF, partial [Acetobacteraceae bacterium]|nr:flagellar M-ring protein FliF [Acetobacteraceae bacterium]
VSMLADGGGAALMGAASGARALPAPGAVASIGSGNAALLTDDRMVEMANIEGQVRASSLRRLADLVEKHPDESLSIMRGWMSTER